MSMTTMVKQEILYILQDEEAHSAAEIKDKIRAKYPQEEITEGVFANALRTMTIAGLCQNLDRGIYKIGVIKEKKCFNAINGQSVMKCTELKKQVLKMVREMRSGFGEMVKDVDMSVEDVSTLQYILKVRAALDKFENEIGN